MEDERKLEISEFKRRIESAETRIYPECITEVERVRNYSTIFVPLIIFFILLGYYIQIEQLSLIIPILLVFAIMVVVILLVILVIDFKKLIKAYRMGFQNLTRVEVSKTIHVLDLLSHGLRRDGKIKDTKSPLDYSPTTIGALKKALKVVSKIFEETESNWIEHIKQIIDETSPGSKRNLLALLLIMFCFSIIWWLLVMLVIFEIIPPTMSIYYFIIPFFIGAGIMMALEEFTNRKPLPSVVQKILKEHEIQEQIVLVVNTLLATLKEDAKYPLRFLVLRTYPNLEYTGKTFRTANELELKEAVHILNE